jgi:hypothetical protein
MLQHENESVDSHDGYTSGAGTAYTSGAPEFTSGF